MAYGKKEKTFENNDSCQKHDTYVSSEIMISPKTVAIKWQIPDYMTNFGQKFPRYGSF